MPEEMKMEPPLTLPDKYFTGQCHLPTNLKNMRGKSEKELEERVRMTLLTMTEKTFEGIGYLIDGSKLEERRFD